MAAFATETRAKHFFSVGETVGHRCLYLADLADLADLALADLGLADLAESVK